MNSELEILSDDLKVYIQGFEVALQKEDITDAVRCLKKMRNEVDENLEFLTDFYREKLKENGDRSHWHSGVT